MIRTCFVLLFGCLLSFSCSAMEYEEATKTELLSKDLVGVVVRLSGWVHCRNFALPAKKCNQDEFIDIISQYNQEVGPGQFVLLHVFKGEGSFFEKVSLNPGKEQLLDALELGKKYLIFADKLDGSPSAYFVHPCNTTLVTESFVQLIQSKGFQFNNWLSNNLSDIGCREVTEFEWESE